MRNLCVLTLLLIPAVPVVGDEKPASSPPAGTIAFSSLGPRGWDLYLTDTETRKVLQRTQHAALDYNAAFSPDGTRIAFVSERDGNLELYVMRNDGKELKRLTSNFALDDHPTWSPDGKHLAFVSTRQPAKKPGQAWNAIYRMNVEGGDVQRLSAPEVTDYSPCWSPGGDVIAFASGSGVAGGTDIYVMKPDGSERRLVIKNGGWPAFVDGGAGIAFHSERKDGWGIWRVALDGSGLKRLTPPRVNAYTPRASADGKRLALVVGREGRRQIEIMDVSSGKLTSVTEDAVDHWNPTLSPDGKQVVYHKSTPGFTVANAELWGTPPETRVNLLRLAGAFPAFSPDHKRVALTAGNFSRLDVMNLDGSARKNIYSGDARTIFSLSWSKAPERIAFSHGRAFSDERMEVNVEAINPDGADHRKLTSEAGNNAFPSFSPDGKQLVFRSGREGSKNLHVINRDGGEVRRLTKGKWTDTMCDWSPTGEWIAFASDRDGDYAVWLIKPDGTGLRKLIGGGGRHNHPHFSPDAQWIVFTSQRAGYSAEEISLPSQPQPYGDLFMIRVNGTGLTRLTHNGFEEGTPAWAPVSRLKPSSEGSKLGGREY